MASSPALGPLDGCRVVVVGSGVIGLTAALRLREAGAHVEVVASESFPMVSIAACAFWLPAWVPGPMADMLGGAVDRSVVEPSWHAYWTLFRRHGAAAGIRSIVNREYLETGQPDPPPWLQELLHPSTIKDITLECEGRSYARRWTFQSVVVDMRIYLRWLRSRAVAHGIDFSAQHLSSLDVADGSRPPDVLVNCSGLGARRLVGDTSVSPVRGQLVHFRTDPGLHDALKAVAINEYYLIPRIDDVVVGGLLREEDDPDVTWAEPDPRDTELLMSKVDTLSELAGAGRPTTLRPTGDSSTGLRPRRHGGFRLEVDRSRATPVVHNYGHGGSGVTLAWGCADRVVELAARELRER